jgi:hypothetical protein
MSPFKRTFGLPVVAAAILSLPLPAPAIPYYPGDLDDDTDVDARDVEAFLSCISGPDVPRDTLCEKADIYGDGDVDQADFGLLQRCISGEDVVAAPGCTGLWPSLEHYGNSGCLSTPLSGDEYPWCGDDLVEITVVGRSLHVVHRSATYNCCPEDIRVDLTVAGTTLLLKETEVLLMPCACLCCYDIESVVVDLLPGYYWVEYCWDDWETEQGCYTEFVLIE